MTSGTLGLSRKTWAIIALVAAGFAAFAFIEEAILDPRIGWHHAVLIDVDQRGDDVEFSFFMKSDRFWGDPRPPHPVWELASWRRPRQVETTHPAWSGRSCWQPERSQRRRSGTASSLRALLRRCRPEALPLRWAMVAGTRSRSTDTGRLLMGSRCSRRAKPAAGPMCDAYSPEPPPPLGLRGTVNAQDPCRERSRPRL